MSSTLVGCILGALGAGAYKDRFGRKTALWLAALLFIISAIGTFLSDETTGFMVYRLMGGLGIGFDSTVSSRHISEISPPDWR